MEKVQVEWIKMNYQVVYMGTRQQRAIDERKGITQLPDAHDTAS